jgi:hypothetical protein
MRRLLTGYAITFNRRHRRSGHLFQNRYKSILVEEEPYLLELARYIHLNPIRVGLIRDLDGLDRYPWSGHSSILGRVPRPWHAVEEILRRFGARVGSARSRYRQFVAEGIARGRRPELQGGGLRRSAGGWEAIGALRRGRERWAADERVLGSGAFVEAVRREADRLPMPWPRAQAAAAMGPLIQRVAAVWSLPPMELVGGSRRQPVPAARAAVCALAVNRLGIPAAAVARAMGISQPSALRAAARGQAALATTDMKLDGLLDLLREDLVRTGEIRLTLNAAGTVDQRKLVQ